MITATTASVVNTIELLW